MFYIQMEEKVSRHGGYIGNWSNVIVSMRSGRVLELSFERLAWRSVEVTFRGWHTVKDSSLSLWMLTCAL